MGRRSVLVAALVAALMSFSALPARAADDKTALFVNLTAEDAHAQAMALELATRVLAMGHPVAVFLNVGAVGIAIKSVTEPAAPNGEKTPRQMLEELMAKGGKVLLCAMCTRRAGLSVDDRLPGVEIANEKMLEFMMRPATKILSY